MSSEKLLHDEATASHEDVEVHRQLTLIDGGVVGSIEIRPLGEAPVLMIHVVDEFPTDLPIEAVGFRSDMEPEWGDITAERADINQTVEDEPVHIEYGIKLSEPVETVKFDPPRIEDVETADFTRSATSDVDGSDETNVGDSDETNVDHSDEAVEDASDEVVEQAIVRIDGSGGAEYETGIADDGAAGMDADEPEEFEAESATIHGTVSGSSPSEELETAVEEEEEEAFSEDGPEDAPKSPERRSVEARIDWLTVRVEKFAAYATTLEELIDEYEATPEFVDETRRELAELDERLRTIDHEVDSVRAAHSEELEDLDERTDALDNRIASAREALGREIDDVHDRVDHVDEEVERINGAVERVDAELTEQSSDVERVEHDVDGLEGRVAGMESEVESVRETVRSVEDDVSAVSANVESMREELEALRTEVEVFNDVRESMANALNISVAEESPADD